MSDPKFAHPASAVIPSGNASRRSDAHSEVRFPEPKRRDAPFRAAVTCALLVIIVWGAPAIARGGFMHGMGGFGMHGGMAEEWIGAKETRLDGATASCIQVAKLAGPTVERPSEDPNASSAPWGLQLIGDSSESRALSEYAELQRRYRSLLTDRAPTVLKKPLGGRGPSIWYLVRVAESTYERAMQLCSKLKFAGGSCIVTRN